MLSAEAFEEKHKAYLSEYKTLKERKQALNIRIGELQLKRSEIKAYIKKLSAQPHLVTEFDESLYCATVETMTINIHGSAVVRFKDGSEVEWVIPEAKKA
jgi:predicted  nucleic acid-binding Zn-ribbon protein